MLLNHNPLDDISHTRDQMGVMIDGRYFPREALDKMVKHFVTLDVEYLTVED